MSYWTDETFEHPALLGRLLGRERVAGVEGRVPEDDVAHAVVFLRARLQHHFDAAPAGPRILGGLRILVDLDLLTVRCFIRFASGPAVEPRHGRGSCDGPAGDASNVSTPVATATS